MSLLSKKARYALHGLAFISHRGEEAPVPFDEILHYLRSYASRLALSPSYIAKIFQEVSRAGFTSAHSGPRGGYQLARGADEIPLIEVVEALDGPIVSRCCLLSVGNCPQEDSCGVRVISRDAELAFYRHFESETVESLMGKMTFP